MIILTTLKQKDLAAVSAQQLFDNYYVGETKPKKINRYEQFEIIGHFDQNELLEKIENSYVFANPNKHHLITSPDHFNANETYFNVCRKSPLNLNSKVKSLNQLIGHGEVTAVHSSELWAFQIDTPTQVDELKLSLIESSSNNLAPFAHPLIHDVAMITFEDLVNALPKSQTTTN
ncbi:MAG: hypothetical protein VW397_06915 [Candidatus Margulisiibacteriota bacterium]